MNLTNTKQVRYSSIARLFNKSQKRELRLIRKANNKFGNWIEAKMNINELKEVYLMHHRTRGCGGLSFKIKDFILVPFSGSKLIVAYQRMTNKTTEYCKYSERCYNNIEHQKEQIMKGKITPLILAETPLEISLSSGWIKNHKSFVILDGLHRSLAILDLKKPKNIKVFIAVKDTRKYL